MSEVQPLFDEPMTRVDPPAAPRPEPTQNDYAQSIAIIQRWRRILALRWLALLALVGASAIWGLTAIDPQPWRFIAACGYSLGVLVPVFVLYFCRSD